MSFTNPTFPAIKTVAEVAAGGAGAIFGPFKLEPMDVSALISLSGAFTGATVFIESSADNGVNDPYGPAACLRQSTLTLDSMESAGLLLANNQTYRWRVNALIEGGYVRVRVTALTTGVLRCNMLRSGHFFLDAPPAVNIEVGGAGSPATAANRLMLLELMRARIALMEISGHDKDEVSLVDVDDEIAAAQ